MNSVNINEFYTAGLSFNIQAKDLEFFNGAKNSDVEIDDDDARWAASPNNPENWKTWEEIAKCSGELQGYTDHGVHRFTDDRSEMESEYLCDTTELSDDMPALVEMSEFLCVESEDDDAEEGISGKEAMNRLYEEAQAKYAETGVFTKVDGDSLIWKRTKKFSGGRFEHIKDAHIAERDAAIALYMSLDVKTPMHGEMQRRAEERKTKYLTMMHFVDTCTDMAKLRRMQDKMWKLFIGSTKFCVKTGDWWQIYMTKQDVRQVSDFITAKRKWFLYGQVVDAGLVEYFKEQQAEAAAK